MKQVEAELSKELIKEKIRERYSQKNNKDVIVIPAIPQKYELFNQDRILNVVVYVRVSTDDPRQTTSYELQKTYYTDFVDRNENWNLVGIYADEGISGTNSEKRDQFLKMIEDCKKGSIDLIIVKNVARFARNVVDCISYSRILKSLPHPVGVYFESERIYTLDENGEFSLSFIATMAQEESHAKSISMNASIEMRFKNGILLTPPLLGYDNDEEGNLVINEEESKTVLIIFYLYLIGTPVVEIAEYLEFLHRRTKLNNETWSTGSIIGILRNERYCGDVIAHKTYTPTYLDHKSVKNVSAKPKYHYMNHHEPIVDREIFRIVQIQLDIAKYRIRRTRPELRVIHSGSLKGFIQINPTWPGFSSSDYINVCCDTMDDNDYLLPTIKFTSQKDDYDFRSFEVARNQFVKSSQNYKFCFYNTHFKFNSACLRIFDNAEYVELLFHPIYQLFVIRRSDKRNPHAVKWCSLSKDSFIPRTVRGTAFLPLIYEICEWNPDYIYKLTGFVRDNGSDRLLLFYADEPEVITDAVKAFPKEWSESYGDNYYSQKVREEAVLFENEWDSKIEASIAKNASIAIPSDDEISSFVNQLVSSF